MTTDGRAPDTDPFIKVDLREEQAVARAFRYTNDISNLVFITNYFRMPPDPVWNKYDSIAYFTVPKSYLDKHLHFYVAVKDDSRIMTHAMPNTVIGVTEEADVELWRSLFEQKHQRFVFQVGYFPDKDLVKHLAMSKCWLEISCHPIQEIQNMFGTQQIQKWGVLGKIQEMDIYNAKDKWQYLSKDLA